MTAPTSAVQVLFGLPINPLTMDQVLDRCQRSLVSRERMLIGVVNAAKIVKLRQDELLRDSMLECDVILADGQSVVWASRILRRRLPERVAGIDLFERLLQLADDEQRSIFLLGAQPEVLALLHDNVGARFPRLRIAGERDGYFDKSDSAEVATQISESGADMLFLGMTSPKKEIFLGEYASGLGVPVLHGVGGSFDILAGVTKRAPDRWQRLGFEWFFRLLQEPRRLWRRYLSTNSAFVLLTIRELVHRTPSYTPSTGR